MNNSNSPVSGPTTASGEAEKALSQAMGDMSPTREQHDYTGDLATAEPLAEPEALEPASGNSGTVIFAGFISQEEYNAKLIGREGLLKFDEMRKSDPAVRWSLQVIKLPIRAAEWSIAAASDDPVDQERADFVDWNLFERLAWTSTIREIMSYLDFGFYTAEKCFAVEDYTPKPEEIEGSTDDEGNKVKTTTVPTSKPMVVLTKLANRKQTTIFRWEMGNGAPGVTQVTAQGTFEIPENRLFLLTHEREGNNYQGVSLLRSAYKPWYMKDALEKISAVAAERQGVGVVKIKQLNKPAEPERQAAIESARNLRANEEGFLEEPPGFDINFMDMFAHSTIDVGADIERNQRSIMMNVGAAFMEMGATRSSGSTGGSKSASGDQSIVYELAVEAIANEIEEAINMMVIRPLIDLNYSGVKRYPRLKHNKIGQDDLASYATAVSNLINADAITPDADMEQALRDRADLPEIPEDIRKNYAERIRSQASTVPQFAPGTAPGQVPAVVPPVDKGKGGAPLPPAPAPTTGNPGKTPTKPDPTVKAGEIVESVKKFYSNLGDQIDAAEAS